MTSLDSLLQKSKAVRTFPLFPLPEIELDLTDVKNYNWSSTNIKEWLSPVIDLSGFEYVYPVNGITEGLNYWMWQEDRIWMHNGDYQWITPSVPHQNMGITYLTTPSAIDGNFKEVPNLYDHVLDIAYVGSTKIEKINIHNNVQKIFFSLSKCFGLRNIRTGWYFSKTPDKKLELLIGSAKYYNYYAQAVAEYFINKYDIDIVYKTLRPIQEEVCQKFDLIPSDVVWLATTNDPAFEKFRRGDVCRVCISEEISTAYHSRIATN